jgi:hypothetical protein
MTQRAESRHASDTPFPVSITFTSEEALYLIKALNGAEYAQGHAYTVAALERLEEAYADACG